MEALGKFVLIQYSYSSVTPGGVHIPETAQQLEGNTGEVMSIGDKVESKLKVGDIVFFSTNVGVKVPDRLGKHLQLVHIDHVLAIL